MTLNFEAVQDSITMNQHASYIKFISKVVARTHRHNPTDCYTRTTKVVGIERIPTRRHLTPMQFDSKSLPGKVCESCSEVMSIPVIV